MKRTMLLAAVLAPALCRAAEIPSVWQEIRASPAQASPAGVPVAPAAAYDRDHDRPGPGRREQRSYGRGGYSFQSEAESARAEAERNMRAAGVMIMVSRVVKDAGFPFNYSFTIEFFEDERSIESYTSGADYSFDSNARPEMARMAQNFQRAGYKVILAQVRKQDGFPFNYYYQIDYFKGGWRRQPPQRRDSQEYRSGPFREHLRAQIAMNIYLIGLREGGSEILETDIVSDRGQYYFRIIYRQQGRGDDRGRGRDRDRDHGRGRGPR